MRYFILSAALLLCGCAHDPSPAQLSAQDDATCTGYGLQKGTHDYAQCRFQQQVVRELHAQNAALRRANFQRAMNAASANLRASQGVICQSAPGYVHCQ